MRIVRADGSVVEGTPAEIAEFEALERSHAPSHLDSFGAQAIDPKDNYQQVDEPDWEFVSADLAFRAMTRLKLSKQQKAMIRKIYSGGSEWTSATDIQLDIGYTPSQFAGLMGAFGRRLANTPGYVVNSAFFEQEWDDNLSCYRYRLPPSVRDAVVRARVVDGK